jgi:Fanconi anemia group D2 protein
MMFNFHQRTQDVSQINQVPVLKRALERLVLRVKQMLAINHCQRAFWVGNLKNKTLKVSKWSLY